MLKRTLLGLMLFVGLSQGAWGETRTYVVPEVNRDAFEVSLKAAAGDLIARKNGIIVLSDGRQVHASGEPVLLDVFGDRLKGIDTRIAQAPANPVPIPLPSDGQPTARRPGRDTSPEADQSREVHRLVGELQRIIDKQNRIQDEALKAARTPIADRVNRVYRTHGPVADLASTLRGIFVDSTIAAEPVGNSILVSATQADAPIIEALLRELDVVPARVRISVLVAELNGATESWQPKGTWDEARRELEALAAKGNGSILRRIHVSTLDNQIAQTQMSENVSLPTGSFRSPRGETSRTFEMHQVGTTLTCTPRVDQSGNVMMEIAYEMSRLVPETVTKETAAKEATPPEETPPTPERSFSRPVPTGFVTSGTPPTRQTKTRTTVSIPKGKAISISDFATQDGSAPSRLILVVGCEVQ